MFWPEILFRKTVIVMSRNPYIGPTSTPGHPSDAFSSVHDGGL